MNSADDILSRLSQTLLARRDADPTTSYTAKLLAKGQDAILKKIGEETTELVMAAKDGDRQHLVCEAADVLYHMMVLLACNGLTIDEVRQELHRREGVSGIEEKNSRGQA